MKRLSIILILSLVAVLLAACGGTQAPAPVSVQGGETYTSEYLDTSYPDAISVRNQLALGTLRLEDTSQAITPEQAAKLLPLWQALRSIFRSGKVAPAEVNALLSQIEDAMTPEQLAAIRDMQLTRADLQAWMQSQGIQSGAGSGQYGAGKGLSPEERATRQALREGGEGLSPEMRATALLDAVIDLLSSRQGQ